jgi:hypothetical protein
VFFQENNFNATITNVIAPLLCALLQKKCQCHHHQPKFSLLLLFAPFQEDVVNATITNVVQVTKAIYYFLH